MQTVQIEGARIIGVMLLWQGTTPFDRCEIIVEAKTKARIRVHSYPDAMSVCGAAITVEEVDALHAAQQLVRCDLELQPRAAAWAIRGSFDELPRLLTSFKLVLGTLTIPDCTVYFVREDSVALTLRDAWATASRLQAIKALRCNNLELAVGHARNAFCFQRELAPETVALVICTAERAGNKARAVSYLMMARRSRGEGFVQQVTEARGDLERLLR